MLGGCTVFLVVAFTSFGLAVWPHLLFPHAERAATVRMCLLIGLPPSLIVGLAGSRLGALAGACGFVAGAVTTGVFLFLRLQQIFVTADVQTGPKPDYPSAMMVLLPLGWFLIAVAAAAVATPRVRARGLGAENNP